MASGTASAAPSDDQYGLQQVRVFFPQGITAEYPRTSIADADTKYVTIENVRARNPSGTTYQPYAAKDFHLIVFERARPVTYYPIVRPQWKSLDFFGSSMALPNETINVTVTFQVPNSAVEANFEFMPGWADPRGGYTDFMYYPNGKAF